MGGGGVYKIISNSSDQAPPISNVFDIYDNRNGQWERESEPTGKRHQPDVVYFMQLATKNNN